MREKVTNDCERESYLSLILELVMLLVLHATLLHVRSGSCSGFRGGRSHVVDLIFRSSLDLAQSMRLQRKKSHYRFVFMSYRGYLESRSVHFLK